MQVASASGTQRDALLANISSKGFMGISAWQPTDTLKDLVSFRVYLQRFDRPV